MTALKRARADFRRGEPWLARDRLLGALQHQPTDQDVVRGLAEAYQELGDLPAAGACWFLTDAHDSDPTAGPALAAMRTRYRSAAGLAHAVRVRGRITDYPMPARLRILDLQAELKEAGWTWTPPSRPRPPDRQRRHPLLHDAAETSKGVLGLAVAVAFVVANLGIYVIGLIAIQRWIW